MTPAQAYDLAMMFASRKQALLLSERDCHDQMEAVNCNDKDAEVRLEQIRQESVRVVSMRHEVISVEQSVREILCLVNEPCHLEDE